ncbi:MULTISPECIES: DUF5994 family protein [Streptomyces]|uniref:Uncharacterized protein n=1 Tax=Streptomyces venezuelae (strain ATCC 10712 / CBS 650.69 / DSM 40230 / JCM 4526 / NBRC 13096 / PD 04745) TaxID=953739 RepID=F2RAG0_STRVP|nr:DUF5994 family protein [Streptomyces venezuelae]APE22458.1 hypothetical protein vnz_16535 [Streptomyces venezuelae]QER99840.1 hypothetical protein DEJ43_16745 [Streptomyces venezuelae ATCC 10712]CCA56642.1 hypothetical protein SVEN_3356 [Streptomyces venezuelae ATCC 10712]
MTTILDRTANRALTPGLPARLSLTPKTTLAGRLDGAWWPRSRDLAAELPALADALEGRWGRITRVLVHPGHWPVVPHKVAVTGHVLHVGWFTEQDPDKVILLSYTTGRCDLLVIPPETEPASVARLMTAAALPGSILSAGGLMSGEAATGRRMREARSREDAWENDGGAASASLAHPAAHAVVGARMIPLPGHTRGT